MCGVLLLKTGYLSFRVLCTLWSFASIMNICEFELVLEKTADVFFFTRRCTSIDRFSFVLCSGGKTKVRSNVLLLIFSFGFTPFNSCCHLLSYSQDPKVCCCYHLMVTESSSSSSLILPANFNICLDINDKQKSSTGDHGVIYKSKQHSTTVAGQLHQC